MPALRVTIEETLRAAVSAAAGEEHADADPMVRPAKDPKFGDFQANLAMKLGKQLGTKPRDLAQAIVDALPADGPFAATEVAGPGFINITLGDEVLAARAAEALGDERLGVAAGEGQTVVIDYGSPNLAKEMHIGHLRSSIIGDALTRVLMFLGDTVIRANHVGDWGTQFGMLVEHLVDEGWTAEPDESRSIADLNAMYKAAKERFDADEDFKARARARVGSLQGGDEASLAIWRQLTEESARHMYAVYDRLGVLIDEGDWKPESFYNAMLASVCEDLEKAQVAEVSEGALCVFKDGDETPMIVRKSDGGYGYATTDLAAIRYRVGELGATRVIYVVDARQAEHFKKVFDGVRRAGWAGDEIPLEHVAFGTILGADKKPYKTREGDVVRLMDVLDEAVTRAAAVLEDKEAQVDDPEATAAAVGVGSLKYADLSNDRIKDYVFDWERMLALDGNTAPYLINAYVRTRSLFRKAEEKGVDASLDPSAIAVCEPAERALVLLLDRFGETVESVGSTLKPHLLCTYLFELARALHRFWESCPVLKDDVDAATRASRLALVELTGRTLRKGLELLGLTVIERM